MLSLCKLPIFTAMSNTKFTWKQTSVKQPIQTALAVCVSPVKLLWSCRQAVTGVAGSTGLLFCDFNIGKVKCRKYSTVSRKIADCWLILTGLICITETLQTYTYSVSLAFIDSVSNQLCKFPHTVYNHNFISGRLFGCLNKFVIGKSLFKSTFKSPVSLSLC